MIRFWTFAVGLGLIVLAAHNMGRAGFDPQEVQLLGAMIALLAFALTVELFGGWVEQIYADRKDMRETMLAEHESARDAGEEPDGGALLREQAEPVKVDAVTRWLGPPRPAQEFDGSKTTVIRDLPPKKSIREDPWDPYAPDGGNRPDTAPVDPEGKAADHG